ncbi:MAG: ABC transporter ATP-binding protein [Proteobacteria bacterium]|nr:ABC transporter ATP-binding protein [Pseudomonadota bacterium]
MIKDNILLSVQNLSVGFKNTQTNITKIVVEDLSFDLEKGKTLALVGESGSGKSVSAFSILKLLPYPVATHPTGAILFHDKGHTTDLLTLKDKDLNAIRGIKIGMVFQEPLSALNPLRTVFEQISEPLFIHGLTTKKEAKDNVIHLLEMVDFKEGKDKLNAYPHQLSGGQRQRVMIAQALSCNPQILIADEPTTALDVTIQASIIELLKDLSKKNNMSILLISHDLHMVKKMADSVCVMKQGNLVETNSTKEIFENPQNDYTKMLIESEPKGSPKPIKNNAPTLLETNQIVVEFKKQSFNLFQKNTPFLAVNGIDLTIKQGETLGIVGESGSGKTSLMFAILRLLPFKGSVIFNGQDLSLLDKKNLRHLRKDIQVIFQDPFGALNPRLTIQQIIEEGLGIHFPELNEAEKQSFVLSILKDVYLNEDVLTRYPHEFSGGQRQRISLARSLILKPKLLCLDEPTSALDRSIQAEILDLLKALQEKYQLSYLFVTHDLAVIRSISHRLIVMKNGKIVEQGQTEEIILNPKNNYTQNLFAAAFNH